MKKIVSFIITFIMCFVSPLSIANAQEQPNNQNLISIENISNTSKYYGQKIKFITSDEFNLDDLQSYDVILQYEKLKDGSENYYFMDKSASNIITIKSNNDVYLDGFPVKIQTFNKSGQMINEEVLKNNTIVPFAQTSTYLKTPPSGTSPSDYNVYVDTIYKRVLFGNTLIKNIAENTFYTLVAAAIGGIPGTIASVVLGSVYSAAKVKIPNNNALSTEQDIHKKMYVGGYTMVTKHTTKYYVFDDFTNLFSTSTHYVAYSS